VDHTIKSFNSKWLLKLFKSIEGAGMTAGREGREINERDESYEQPQTESRVPVVYETLVLIVLRLKNPTPKRFFREHRGTHSKNDTQTGTERERNRNRKETQHTHTLRPCWWEGVWSQIRAPQGEERGV
jgi:hypothetical protein